MPSDDLNAPLGQDKKPARRKLPIAAPQFLAGLLGLFGLVVLGWATFVNDPLGGEPVVVLATKPVLDGGKTTGKTAGIDAGDDQEHRRHDGIEVTSDPAADKAAVPPGSRTVTIIDGSSGKSTNVVIPGHPGEKTGEPAEHRSEVTPALERKIQDVDRHGAIPKVAADGTRASALYAEPRPLPVNRKDAPRIAIILGGVGISASGTAEALSMLPAAVTFAVTPYGADIERLAERVRGEHHEVLLQTPMEPFDYPNNDPGPQTLLTTLTPAQNIDRLHWLMSRFKGYVGISTFMGARFTASEPALAPVLQEAAKRGLIFVDASASGRSLAAQIAGSQSLPFAKVDMVIDSVPTPIEVDRALARLELMARENGTAVGLATAQPGTVKRIAGWAKTVESRGFVLVPITMVAAKSKSS